MAAHATAASPLSPIQDRATDRSPSPTMNGTPSRTMYPSCLSMNAPAPVAQALCLYLARIA